MKQLVGAAQDDSTAPKTGRVEKEVEGSIC
jgi:hypothetical protein